MSGLFRSSTSVSDSTLIDDLFPPICLLHFPIPRFFSSSEGCQLLPGMSSSVSYTLCVCFVQMLLF